MNASSVADFFSVALSQSSSIRGEELLAFCVAVIGGVDTFHSLRGNFRSSYLCFILAEAPGSVLENKGCRVLCGVHLGLVQFTVNTLAGASQRSHMSVCVWVWRLLSRCFHRVKLQMEHEKMGKRSIVFRKMERK